MMNKENEMVPATPEFPDAIDELIVAELGRQARMRATLQAWESRQRRARRLRLAPLVSNLLSAAAMLLLVFILQAMIPKTALATRTPSEIIVPAMELVVEPADSIGQ